MKYKLALAALAAAVLSASACGSSAQGAAQSHADDSSQAAGSNQAHPSYPHDPTVGRAEFIEHHCDTCHGGLAGGGMGPNLRQIASKQKASDIHDIILKGKPKGMPDWHRKGMSDREAWLIVSYLETLGKPDEPKFFLDYKQHLPKGEH